MKKPVFRGSAVALITPYTKDGSAVDFEAYGVLIDRQIALGTAALVVCATTGEAPTLSRGERAALIRACGKGKDDIWTEDERATFSSAYLRFSKLFAEKKDVILIFGSLSFMGDFRELLMKRSV